jgi:hypothetical protein
MDEKTLEMVFEVLADLRGYSGVGLDGDPYDTPSWNAALVAAQEVILHRYSLGAYLD